jgi:hypothetical protein
MNAHLLRVKTLDEFGVRQVPMVSPTRMSELAEGRYMERTCARHTLRTVGAWCRNCSRPSCPLE